MLVRDLKLENISRDEAVAVAHSVSNYGEGTAEFKGFILEIKYDTCPSEDPFEWPDWGIEGFGVDLSNHRSYTHYGAPTNIPGSRFAEWYLNDQMVPEYECHYECPKCGHEWDFGLAPDRDYTDNCEKCGKLNKPADAEPTDEFYEEAAEWSRDHFWLPVYMYMHSGTTIKTTPFSCRWDSGMAGMTYVPKKTAMEVWGDLEGDALEEKAHEYLRSMVGELDAWFRGEVYGYVLTLGDNEDGCWGYVGDAGRKQALCDALTTADAIIGSRH